METQAFRNLVGATMRQKKPQTFNVEMDRSFSSSEKMKMKCRGLLLHSSHVERYCSLKREDVL